MALLRSKRKSALCVKYIFFSYNILFWGLGLSALSLGVWIHLARTDYGQLAKNYSFMSAAALVMTSGCIAIMIGFLGCCGSWFENRCLILTYFVFVCIVFLVEISVGVTTWMYKNDIDFEIRRDLLDSIENRYPFEGHADPNYLRGAWDEIQTRMECCGVDSYMDWIHAGKSGGTSVPDSCCRYPNNQPDCGHLKGNDNGIHKQGCYLKLKEEIHGKVHVVISVLVICALVQVFGLILAMVLFCLLRRYEDRE